MGLAPNPYLRANMARSVSVALLLIFITLTLLFLLSSRLGVAHQSVNVRLDRDDLLHIPSCLLVFSIELSELASHLTGTCYVTRQSVETVASIRKAKKAIRKAFEASMQGKGSSLVEIVSTCNSGWKLSPVEANKWMEENMFKEYPKGDLKDTTGM